VTRAAIECLALVWQGNAADMVHLIDHPIQSTPVEADAPVADPSTVSDRRRPARREWINPALLHLLRGPVPSVDRKSRDPGQSTDTIPGQPIKWIDIDPDDDTDDLTAGRGIIVGMLLSIPTWAIIGLGIWYIF
jgi:hypothetical protein